MPFAYQITIGLFIIFQVLKQLKRCTKWSTILWSTASSTACSGACTLGFNLCWLWHRDSASADLFSRGRSNQILHYKAWYVRTYSSGHLRHPKSCSEYYAAINSRLTHPWLHDCSLTAAHLSRRPTVVLAVQLRLKNLGQLLRWRPAPQEADLTNPAMVVEK